MHRRVKIPRGIEGIDFFGLAKKERHSRVRMRLLALGHFKEGKKQKEIAEYLGVHRDTLRDWRLRFEEGGVRALEEGHRSGPRPKLVKGDEERFRQEIESVQQKRLGGRLKGEEIRALLEKNYEAVYSLNGVYALLKRLGMVWISARSKHPKSDLAAQEGFKKTSRKRLKR